MRLCILSTLLCLMVSATTICAESELGAGLRKLAVSDPIGENTMDAVVFYPASTEEGPTTIGPFVVAASKSAPIASARYPLIIVSHGSLGSMWGHHDLATFLARHGYIVVSVTHPGDNFRDPSRVGSSLAVYGRAMQISAALTAALKDPVLTAHIDHEHIGFVGFSAGGTTGLILAGAKPDFKRFATYCAGRLQDRSVCEANGHVRQETPELEPLPDARIRSFALLAPLSVVFSPETLKAVRNPVAVFVGSGDEELSPRDNGLALAHDLGDRAELILVPKAGHFTFLAPCTTEYQRAVPALCIDPPGIDRPGVHKEINADIVNFFDRTLGRARQ